MAASAVFAILWERRWLLAGIVVLSAAAAVPFALAGSDSYASTTDVLVPTNLPLPSGSAVAAMTSSRTTVLSERLTTYVEDDLESDVRSELGDQGSQLTDISVAQNLEDSTFRLTAEATAADVAESAAELGAARLIARADDIAGEIVTALQNEIAEVVEPAVEELTQLREDFERTTSRMEALRQERAGLISELTAAKQDRLRAEDQGADTAVFDERISDLRAEIRTLEAEIEDMQPRRTSLSTRINILESRVNTLSQLEHQSTAARLTRLASSSVIDPPSAAGSSVSSNIFQLVLIAVAAGLLVGSAVILFMGRRRITAASSEPGGELRGASPRGAVGD